MFVQFFSPTFHGLISKLITYLESLGHGGPNKNCLQPNRCRNKKVLLDIFFFKQMSVPNKCLSQTLLLYTNLHRGKCLSQTLLLYTNSNRGKCLSQTFLLYTNSHRGKCLSQTNSYPEGRAWGSKMRVFQINSYKLTKFGTKGYKSKGLRKFCFSSSDLKYLRDREIVRFVHKSKCYQFEIKS